MHACVISWPLFSGAVCETGSSQAVSTGGNLFSTWDLKSFVVGSVSRFHIKVYVSSPTPPPNVLVTFSLFGGVDMNVIIWSFVLCFFFSAVWLKSSKENIKKVSHLALKRTHPIPQYVCVSICGPTSVHACVCLSLIWPCELIYLF